MQVIDKNSGKPIEIPDEQVQAAFQGGLIALPPTARIPIQRATGEVGTVPAAGLDQELDAGARVMPQADYEKAALQKQYGGPLGMAEAAGAGVARTLTFGGSDVAARALGAGDTLQKLKTANPASSFAGEAVGAIAPVLATDGAAAPEEAGALGLGEAAEAGGALARVAPELDAVPGAAEATTQAPGIGQTALNAATWAPRATAEASNLIERSVGAVIGDNSPNVFARAAQKAVAKGAGGAFEGALYNMGNQISEDALGDQDTTAEKLFAAAGHGAVFGGALGAGFGTVAGAGEAALGKIARSPTVERLIESEAWRSISPRKAFVKEAERIPGGWRGVSKEMMSSGVIRQFDTAEDIAPRLEQLRANIGDQIGAHIEQLINAGADGVSVSELKKSIWSQLPDAAFQLKKTAGTMGKVSDVMEDLERLGGDSGKIDLQELQKVRINLDTVINWEKATPGPALQALRATRSAIENTLMDTADKEAQRLNLSQQWRSDYVALKRRYQRIAVADDAAQDTVMRMAANNASSPTARAAGLMVGLGGTAGMVASGHPMGIAGGAAKVAAGAATTYLTKQVLNRGNATMASWLNKAKDLAAVQQVSKRLDAKVATKIGKVITGKAIHPEKIDLDDYDHKVSRVKAAALSHDDVMENHLGSLQQNAPQTSSKFSSVARKATAYLATKIPNQPGPGVFGDPPPVSDADKLTFLKAERAISHPDKVLDDIMSGTLDKDTLDAVQAVYPHYLDEIRLEVTKQLHESPNMPYDRKLQVAMLLGIDPDGMLNQQSIQMFQGTWQVQKSGGSKGSHPKHANAKGVWKAMQLSSRSVSL